MQRTLLVKIKIQAQRSATKFFSENFLYVN